MDFLYASEAKHTVWPDVVARCKKSAEGAAAAVTGLSLGSIASTSASSSSSSSLTASPLRSGNSTARAGSESDSALALFRSAVLTRDRHRCVRCTQTTVSSDSLHAVSLLPRSEPIWLAQGQLLHGFETVNGLTLCSACLPAFESHEWSFAPLTAAVSQATERSLIVDAATGAQHTLRAPHLSDMLQHWPTIAVITAHTKWVQLQRSGGGQHDSALENGHGNGLDFAHAAATGAQKRAHANGSKAHAHAQAF